jgi:hypothetical protein
MKMTMTEREKCANDNRLIIDALKQRFDLKTGVAVANFLGLSKQAVYKMESGENRLGKESRLIIMNALNCSGIENLSERSPWCEKVKRNLALYPG